ncbi:MAG: hypothetical protein R2818_15355 [Flavobacteriales bacterium]
MLDVLAIEAPALPGQRLKDFRQVLFDSYTAPPARGNACVNFGEHPYAQALQVK